MADKPIFPDGVEINLGFNGSQPKQEKPTTKDSTAQPISATMRPVSPPPPPKKEK